MIHGNQLSTKERSMLEERELSQVETIKLFYKNNPNRNFTAEEIKANVLPESLLTSVRRCMTDLTTENFLKKSEIKKSGSYKIKIHCYYHAAEAKQIDMFAQNSQS